MIEERNRRRSPARVRLPLWAVVLIALVCLFLLVGSAVWLFRRISNVSSDIEVTGVELQAEDAEQQVDSAESNNPTSPVVITDLSNPAATPRPGEPTPIPADDSLLSAFKPWEGTERVNILMLGIDHRCDEEGPTRTDSMMVISVDPVGKSVSALSLPRDTWVEIPAFGSDRINQAHYFGEANEYPGGGPALAMETVSNFLGVDIDHFITINFEGFRDFINLIDGIQVNVPEAIDDPTYPDECYGMEGFQIDAGVQSMNGPIALKYARTRASANGDIDRAGRQQAVILAVRQKLVDINMIPSLIARSPQLWRSFQDNMKTSLTDKQVIQLALLAQEVKTEDINTGVIDFNYVYNETTIDGRQVLMPNVEAIRDLRETLFAPVAAPAPVIENLNELVSAESARIVVHNGTQVFGLAGATRDFLTEQGVNVTDVGNADSATFPTTQIIDYGSHPSTVLFLTQVMGLPPLNATSSTVDSAEYDILIILGVDWEVPGGVANSQ